MIYFFPLLVSFAISAILTKFLLILPDHVNWLLREPTSDRWHKKTTPSFGGVGMFVAFMLTLLIFGEWRGDIAKVVLGGGIAFAMGFIDDLKPLPPYYKLAAQIGVSCLMILLGIHALLTWNPLVYIPLTVVWMVGITNAFNLLDNMDGLAGGTALITTIFIAILSMGQSSVNSPLAILVFAGAILGFLIFNRHPARIFMGDCGSQWLGFTLACFAILDTWRTASDLFLMVATPALILAVPIFDTMLVALNRKIHGRPVSQGGRDHSSHRLVALGLSESKTVWVLWGLSVLFGLVALFAQTYEVETWTLLAVAVIIFAVIFGMFLTDVKVYDASPVSAKPQSRILWVTVFYKRRIVEILLDTVLIGSSYVLAYLLRFDWNLGRYHLLQIEKTLPLILATKLGMFILMGLYRGLWTYIDFEGFVKMIRTMLAASVVAVLTVVVAYRFEGFSRTLFAIDFVLLFVLMGGTRALLRALRESVFAFPESGTRLLIVGAGDASRFLLHEIRRNRQWNLRPMALVDDDRRKKGRKILDIPVEGNRDDIVEISRKHSIDRIVIAIPSLAEEDRLEIIKRCDEAGLPYVMMPSLEETLIRQIMR